MNAEKVREYLQLIIDNSEEIGEFDTLVEHFRYGILNAIQALDGDIDIDEYIAEERAMA
jgi:hypothetical protein